MADSVKASQRASADFDPAALGAMCNRTGIGSTFEYNIMQLWLGAEYRPARTADQRTKAFFVHSSKVLHPWVQCLHETEVIWRRAQTGPEILRFPGGRGWEGPRVW